MIDDGIAGEHLINNEQLDDLIQDLLMIDDKSESRRREKIIHMLTRKAGIDEI